jgi:hypothetical protein
VETLVSLFASLDQDQPTVNYEILLHAVYSIVYMPLIIIQNKKYSDYNKRGKVLPHNVYYDLYQESRRQRYLY